jgi:carbonic anhydrase
MPSSAGQAVRLATLASVSQIENLLTYPDVKQGLLNETLHIHGWIYDIESGEIEYYDPDEGKFKSMSALAKGVEND